mmetsp:Transcript_21141/g.49540  ORF Transcript_21141/g.49540 Transcript_21141/m.49540 type:complete len:667 (-) Transcript_21141:3423-5423(-)
MVEGRHVCNHNVADLDAEVGDDRGARVAVAGGRNSEVVRLSLGQTREHHNQKQGASNLEGVDGGGGNGTGVGRDGERLDGRGEVGGVEVHLGFDVGLGGIGEEQPQLGVSALVRNREDPSGSRPKLHVEVGDASTGRHLELQVRVALIAVAPGDRNRVESVIQGDRRLCCQRAALHLERQRGLGDATDLDGHNVSFNDRWRGAASHEGGAHDNLDGGEGTQALGGEGLCAKDRAVEEDLEGVAAGGGGELGHCDDLDAVRVESQLIAGHGELEGGRGRAPHSDVALRRHVLHLDANVHSDSDHSVELASTRGGQAGANKAGRRGLGEVHVVEAALESGGVDSAVSCGGPEHHRLLANTSVRGDKLHEEPGGATARRRDEVDMLDGRGQPGANGVQGRADQDLDLVGEVDNREAAELKDDRVGGARDVASTIADLDIAEADRGRLGHVRDVDSRGLRGRDEGELVVGDDSAVLDELHVTLVEPDDGRLGLRGRELRLDVGDPHGDDLVRSALRIRRRQREHSSNSLVLARQQGRANGGRRSIALTQLQNRRVDNHITRRGATTKAGRESGTQVAESVEVHQQGCATEVGPNVGVSVDLESALELAEIDGDIDTRILGGGAGGGGGLEDKRGSQHGAFHVGEDKSVEAGTVGVALVVEGRRGVVLTVV